MSDRGLPVTGGAQACPFVAFEDDRDERGTTPDPRHRCYAEPRPAPRAIAHQEAYCLASAFPMCPIFQDWAQREAAQARGSAGAGAVAEPPGEQVAALRRPSDDWSAPPPWAGAVAGGAGAAAAAGSFDDGDEHRDEDRDEDREDREFERQYGREDAPGFLSSRSAAAGAGLAGSPADRIAGSGRADGDVTDDARPGTTGRPDQRPAARLGAAAEPDDDRFAQGDDEPYDDSGGDDEFESEPRGRPRSARASGGIGFGRDRRPRVGDTRRGHGGDDAAPSWERPRHNEPYPAVSRGRRISRLGWMAIALVVAAVALFFLPQLLGLGSTPQTGGTTPRPGSSGPGGSVVPTPVPAPTPQIYTVKSGDSMFSIAQQFGLTPDELIEANRGTHPNPDQLQIGDQLVIPTPGAGGSAAPSGSAAP
jgi:LysM domain